MVESFRRLREFFHAARGYPEKPDLLAPRRQERQVRKFNSLRPLGLCGRYCEFWLRRRRAGSPW
jgi:hypothetical protein